MEKNPLAAPLLILWLHLDRVSSILNVEQSPQSLHVQVRDSTNFTCSFPSSNFYALHWYRWETAKIPKALFVMTLNGDEKKKGRISVTLNTKEGYSYLYIKGSQPEDSATYLCAFAQCCSGTCSPYANLCLVLHYYQHWQRTMSRMEKTNPLNYSFCFQEDYANMEK
uniref:T cell receptor alpha variable 24 n=1 Tax=Macaca fascicularis TaxID=9541 RepID=A0A7N9D8V8_MACFA